MTDPTIDNTPEKLPARVIKQLLFLASPLNLQIDKVVGRLGPPIDLNDVAEDFETYANAIWMSVEIRLVSVETQLALKSLDKLLEEMSGPDQAALWEAHGLDSPEWEVVRRRAREILQSSDFENYISQPPESAGELVTSIKNDLSTWGDGDS